MNYRVASSEMRRAAIRTLQVQNKRLWALAERCDKDNPQLRQRLEEEYADNVRRIETIELLDAGAAAYAGDSRDVGGCRGAGSPRLAEERDVPLDWRVRVAGVLESNAEALDPDGQYGLFKSGESGEVDQ